MAVDTYRYTVEGEKLTMAEIVARVLEAHPKLKASTIRKRVIAGLRTWRLLGQSAAEGDERRRNSIRRSLGKLYRR